VLACTARWKHRRGDEPDPTCRATQRVVPSQFTRSSAYPLAPTRGRSQRRNKSKRTPHRRHQRAPPPPIATIRCRSGAIKAARCGVGTELVKANPMKGGPMADPAKIPEHHVYLTPGRMKIGESACFEAEAMRVDIEGYGYIDPYTKRSQEAWEKLTTKSTR